MASENEKDRAHAFSKRLKDFGAWQEVTNMDRFVILVFLTAEEKRAFALKNLGDEHVDYFDGDDVQEIVLKPGTTK